MSISITANILTMIFCAAVLVQSMRMMRNLRTVKDGALTQVVTALEKATTEARSVLFDLKTTLSSDCMVNAKLVEEARSLRDELQTIVSLADGTAERLIAAVGAANEAHGAQGEGDILPETHDETKTDQVTA
ncbi:DUF6468 domain-containing protein [Sphingomonas sp.]|uniref:DUF6468 domain-containing protein n=1 Tax=Sphingomonas sp. TaxID=28214 RepID=UPI001B1178C9|nr:DUF6468 domain-containing protein [Sphingomonas sp.]MBO9713511.1 hypothetical protein [Sphingomonas sp.]